MSNSNTMNGMMRLYLTALFLLVSSAPCSVGRIDTAQSEQGIAEDVSAVYLTRHSRIKKELKFKTHRSRTHLA